MFLEDRFTCFVFAIDTLDMVAERAAVGEILEGLLTRLCKHDSSCRSELEELEQLEQECLFLW